MKKKSYLAYPYIIWSAIFIVIPLILVIFFSFSKEVDNGYVFSLENYKTLMTELAVTENLIAEHRNNYNIQVKQYNKHIKTFPNSMILNMMGYEKLDNTYLEYDASEDAPRNLFNKE